MSDRITFTVLQDHIAAYIRSLVRRYVLELGSNLNRLIPKAGKVLVLLLLLPLFLLLVFMGLGFGFAYWFEWPTVYGFFLSGGAVLLILIISLLSVKAATGPTRRRLLAKLLEIAEKLKSMPAPPPFPSAVDESLEEPFEELPPLSMDDTEEMPQSFQ